MAERNGKFLIVELNPNGGSEPPGGFARFEWDAAHRNIPKGGWEFGVVQRHVRTDYPGADDPTIQVLGPHFTPFTLTGRWDDRFNPKARVSPSSTLPLDDVLRAVRGYAKDEQARFEAMVRRGNTIRITFEDLTIEGVIVQCDFDYRRSWDIGYSFTVEPTHRQPGGFFALKRSPRSALNARQLRGEVSAELDVAVALHARAPRTRLVGTLWADVDTLVTDWVDQLAQIDAAIDQRQLSLEIEANTALIRVGAAFAVMSTIGREMRDLVAGGDSSEALDSETPIGVLDFDAWARGLAAQARRMIVVSERAAADIRQRARPNAVALYRPQEGEHLYAVSNRFYKSPHFWRAIFERNNLTTTSLTGDELLIIPELTGR